jgi:hypothetical protein
MLCVDHFLPGEAYLNAGDRELFGQKNALFHSGSTRKAIIGEAAQVYFKLEYPFIPNVNVIPLVKRYLQEMVLPGIIISTLWKSWISNILYF